MSVREPEFLPGGSESSVLSCCVKYEDGSDALFHRILNSFSRDRGNLTKGGLLKQTSKHLLVVENINVDLEVVENFNVDFEAFAGWRSLAFAGWRA